MQIFINITWFTVNHYQHHHMILMSFQESSSELRMQLFIETSWFAIAHCRHHHMTLVSSTNLQVSYACNFHWNILIHHCTLPTSSYDVGEIQESSWESRTTKPSFILNYNFSVHDCSWCARHLIVPRSFSWSLTFVIWLNLATSVPAYLIVKYDLSFDRIVGVIDMAQHQWQR